MASVKGQEAVSAFLRNLPAQIETKLVRGAARAAATVVADEAKLRTNSSQVADAIRVRTKKEDGRVVAKVQVAGPGAYLAPWEEYGTDPHFISVAEDQRSGMSVRRINTLVKEGSLVIGGQFVGPTVWHPGARAHPFLRPSLDTKADEAMTAAQSYINARVTPSGVAGNDEGDDA